MFLTQKVPTGPETWSVWDEPQRGTPALLDEGDLPAIDASGCLFCRKVDAHSALYGILERRWLED